MLGKKPDFRSSGERKQQLRVNAGCVGTAALGCPHIASDKG
jgi:hypothetical protein